MRLRDDELDLAQAAADKALEERGPEGLRFAGSDMQAHNLPLALAIQGHKPYRVIMRSDDGFRSLLL